MFFGRPESSNQEEKPDCFQLKNGFVGLSSFDIPSFAKVESYKNFGLDETGFLNGDSHQPIDVNIYGNENTGKFYTFLPLIKI